MSVVFLVLAVGAALVHFFPWLAHSFGLDAKETAVALVFLAGLSLTAIVWVWFECLGYEIRQEKLKETIKGVLNEFPMLFH
jgi:hypothetical protein